MDETCLWLKFLEGDKSAFSEIFRNYHDDLYRYGLRLSGDHEITGDCIQNLFLKLWKNRKNLKPVREIRPYLFKSMRHHMIDILEMKKPVIPLESDVEDTFGIGFTTEDFNASGPDEKEQGDRVVAMLNRLTPRQRHSIYLRYFENLEFEAIARIMDMQVQSVRNAISRGLQALRKEDP